MNGFVRGLITEWRKLNLPAEGAVFVIAVSGGADSVALLLAIEELLRTHKLKDRFVVVHFNHKLRGAESDADEQFVKMLCSELKLELKVGHAHLPQHGNLEQNARDARYVFLQKTAETIAAQGVLTAHTLDDQAETFLMNLVRGSGPAGLGGMAAVREMSFPETGETPETPETAGTEGAFGTIKRHETVSELDTAPFLPFSSSPLLLVRPLLGWARRADTEAYCHERQVEYRYDSMNEDLDFTRVRIRKLLIPMLESEFNPKIAETLARTAALLRDSRKGRCGEGEIGDIDEELKLSELKDLEKAELYDLLRRWLEHKRGTARGLTLKHIEAVERLIKSRMSGRMAELPGGRVVKTAGRLVYEDLKVEKRDLDH